MGISVKRPLNSLYVHIPFCKDKCYYCDFVSFNNKNNFKKDYINALTIEISHSLASYSQVEIKSVYIGGGTPTLLEIEHFEQIFSGISDLVKISNNAEITVEANPGTVTLEYLENLKFLGINRLSIGIQSFNGNILKNLNRKHSSQEAIQAVSLAQKAGFNNISVDLIYGLPGQSLKIWSETLNQAVSLDITHISAYGLKIENGTNFAKNLPQNMPDEELSVQMYLEAINIFTGNGFEQYEISNFARTGCQSKHNLSYWRNEEYFGLGLAAHGYVDGGRYSNTSDFDEYIRNPLKKASIHQVTKQEAVEEGIFLGLRLVEGINIQEFKVQYNFDLMKEYKNIIEKYTGFMEIKNGNLRLTTEGILISNEILADFLR